MNNPKYHNWGWWIDDARKFGMTNEQYHRACQLGDVINVMLGRESSASKCNIVLRVHPFVVFCIDGEHRGFNSIRNLDKRGYISSRFTRRRADFLEVYHDHLLDIILGKKENLHD